MSNLVVSLVLSVSGGMWLYYVMAKRTGYGNTKPAAIAGVATAILLFIVIYITFSKFF